MGLPTWFHQMEACGEFLAIPSMTIVLFCIGWPLLSAVNEMGSVTVLCTSPTVSG